MVKTVCLIATVLFISGCYFEKKEPFGTINTGTDSQIFTYTDADVKKLPDGTIKSDDTTLIIIGVTKDGSDIESIFNHAMTEIKEIFEARQEVYKTWIKGE